METTQMNKLYRQFERMINQKAWQAHVKYGIALDDCKSQANVLFMNACATFDPSQASFSSHLGFSLMRLSHMANPKSAENQINADTLQMSTEVGFCDEGHIQTLEDRIGVEDPAFKQLELESLISTLSPEDAEVVSNIAQGLGRPVGMHKELYRKIRKNLACELAYEFA
jgi:hypothetical protein